MNPNKPHDERQVYSLQTNGKKDESMSEQGTGSHYVKHHAYEPEDFAKRGEIIQFNGIRVVDSSGSGESVSFEDFAEMAKSDWTVNGSSVARLYDGTILFEGRNE